MDVELAGEGSIAEAGVGGDGGGFFDSEGEETQSFHKVSAPFLFPIDQVRIGKGDIP